MKKQTMAQRIAVIFYAAKLESAITEGRKRHMIRSKMNQNVSTNSALVKDLETIDAHQEILRNLKH
tara:strand:- start:307 stop:504 length:198 start_codon:yes stop_codon:yes gene_type:complete